MGILWEFYRNSVGILWCFYRDSVVTEIYFHGNPTKSSMNLILLLYILNILFRYANILLN